MASDSVAFDISGLKPPFLRLPDRTAVFARRAARFAALAGEHAMADYLAFMGQLAQAQQAALKDFQTVSLPNAAQLQLCREHHLPPLGAQGWPRDAAWRDALRAMLAIIKSDTIPVTRGAIERLEQADDVRLEAWAGALLSGNFKALDPSFVPFLAAALQAYWVHMAASLDAAALDRIEAPGLCPVCGSAPVASVVRAQGSTQGLRYLCCSLCATEWNMVRIKCANCDSSKDVAYFGIEGDNGAVKAEACTDCKSYLKILYLEKDTRADPTADDLATLALDVLMANAGMARSGPNLFLHPGDG